MKLKLLSVDLSAVWKHVRNRGAWANLAGDVADAALLHWDSLSRSAMSPSTARQYRAGLSRIQIGEAAAVVLSGTFPLMVERGWRTGGVDLRETMLRDGQRGVKTSKSGHKYRRVSFRHDSGTGTGANNVGATPGQAEGRLSGAAEGARVGAEVLSRMRRLQVWRPGMTGYRANLVDLTPKIGKLRDWHTTSIYTGMRRGAAGSGYRTFRTISDNPASMRQGGGGRANWWHPGIQPRNLAPKVRAWVAGVVPQLADALSRRLR